MGLDIRLPIGLMFGTLGGLLSLYGLYGALSGSGEIYARHSLGVNVNLWWGLALVVFGSLMLYFGRRSAARRR